MPSISSNDFGQGSESGRIWMAAIAVVLVCGVGYGVYKFAGPGLTEQAKPVPLAVAPQIQNQLKARQQAAQARRQQADQQFQASLGLTNAQITQLAQIESETTSPRVQAERTRALLSPEQFAKYTEKHPEMRWFSSDRSRDRQGGPGGAAGEGWRGRRRGNDGETSGTTGA